MRIEYNSQFMEQATFSAVRQNPQEELRFRRAQEAAYALEDPEQREEAFQQIACRWFFELELHCLLLTLFEERPLIAQSVEYCFVREAASARKQGAELYVKPSQNDSINNHTLIVELCSDSLLSTEVLAATLRADLLKASDMLDDAFAYSPEIPSTNRPRENLIRDRYRALWDVYVASRLRHENRLVNGGVRVVRDRFNQAFTTHGRLPSTACCDTILAMRSITHDQLLQWAIQPQALPEWSSVDAAQELPGQACPICEFPTYDWYPQRLMECEFVRRVCAIIPSWTIDKGMCRQCVETLQSEQALESRQVT